MPAHCRGDGVGGAVGSDVPHHPFSVRVVLSSEDEVRLVDAVYGPVGGDLSAANDGQGREEVEGAHDPVGRSIGLDRSRPPDYAGDADAAFIDCADTAPEWGEATVGPLVESWSVVAGQNDDGVVLDPQLLKLVQNHAHVMVHLHKPVAVRTSARHPSPSRVLYAGEVGPREGDVYEEGIAGVRLILDVLDRPLDATLIYKRQRRYIPSIRVGLKVRD